MKARIFNGFKQFSKEQVNPVISPLGLEIALSLLLAGSTGDSKKELQEVLEVEHETALLDYLAKKIDSLNEIPGFKQSNTLLYGQQYTLKESYWKKIPSSLALKAERVDSTTTAFAFSLKNILSVKEKWKQPFWKAPLFTDLFTLESGEEIQTLFIGQSNTRGDNKNLYLQEEKFHAIQIPLESERLNFEIYLPYKNDGLNDLLTSLNPEKIQEYTMAFHPIDSMEVVMPKFELENTWQISSSEMLEQMGMDSILSLGDDFQPMLEGGKIAARKISQYNKFNLNENGIEALSNLRIGGVGSISPKEKKHVLFEAIHPFLFILKDKITNTILFLGCFEIPTPHEELSFFYSDIEMENGLSEWQDEDKKSIFYRKIECYSLRTGLMIAAYSLQALNEKYVYKTIDIDGIITKILKITESQKGEVLEHLLTAFLEEIGELMKALDGLIKEEDDSAKYEGVKKIVKDIDFIFSDKIKISREYISAFLISGPNGILNKSFIAIPNFACLEPYLLSDFDDVDDMLWGPSIPSSVFTELKPKPLTSIYSKETHIKTLIYYRSIRRFRVKLWDISIRGKLLLGLVCLNKVVEKENVEINQLEEIINGILSLFEEVDEHTVLKLEKAFSNYYYQEENREIDDFYLTKNQLDAFIAKYPVTYDVIFNIIGCINHLNHNSFFGATSIIENPINILYILNKNDIDLPDLSYFEQFTFESSNEMGPPIKIDKKLIPNLIKS